MLDGLALLRRVPHEHAVGADLDQTLIGEIVPARHGKKRRNAEIARGLHIVGLAVSEIDHRRYDEKVRRPVLQRPDGAGVRGNGPVDQGGKAHLKPPYGRALYSRHVLEGPECDAWKPAAAAFDERRRIVIFGLEIAEIVA